ncbi:hypothetical protein ACF0H5_009114 [Mactra antiquata]
MDASNRKRKRDIQDFSDADLLNLSSTTENCGLSAIFNTSKRRKSIGVSEFRAISKDKENSDIMRSIQGLDTNKSGRDISKNTLRRTLRRRVSMTLMRQKMRKLQDYSLPCQTDNFRFLQVINGCCDSPIFGLRRSPRLKVRH